jgi:hypothetical protein
MPSPFPGMDPYLECREWANFRFSLMAVVGERLVPGIRPRYVARLEERVYLEHNPEERDHFTQQEQDTPHRSGRYSNTVAPGPFSILLPIPEEVRERYITIRERESQELVTVIEVLLPSSKQPGCDGRTHYLSEANLVEVDLLRGGERLPVVGMHPSCDYVVIVSRRKTRPLGNAYPMFLRQKLPVIDIPLSEGDPDLKLDLQSALTSAYDRAGYDYSLDYTRAVDPPLSNEDSDWAADILAQSA